LCGVTLWVCYSHLRYRNAVNPPYIVDCQRWSYLSGFFTFFVFFAGFGVPFIVFCLGFPREKWGHRRETVQSFTRFRRGFGGRGQISHLTKKQQTARDEGTEGGRVISDFGFRNGRWHGLHRRLRPSPRLWPPRLRAGGSRGRKCLSPEFSGGFNAEVAENAEGG